MSSIHIKTLDIEQKSRELLGLSRKSDDCCKRFSNIRYTISSEVLSRRNLSSRASRVQQKMTRLTSELNTLSYLLENAAHKYYEVDQHLKQVFLGTRAPQLIGFGGGSLTTHHHDRGIASWEHTPGELIANFTQPDDQTGLDVEFGTLGGSITGEINATWDVFDGDVGACVKGEALAYVGRAALNYEGRYGSIELSGEVGAVGVEAEAGFKLMENGVFGPRAFIDASATASILSGQTNFQLGNEAYNFFGEIEGDVGAATAEFKASVGADGVSGTAEVGLAAFKGEAKTGFTFFGVKVELSGEAEAFAVGAKANLGVEKNKFEIGGKLSALAGLGLNLKIEW